MVMFEIIPKLYLSAYHDIQVDTPDAFIVNCTKDLPMQTTRNYRLAVDDDGNKNSLDTMFLKFPEVTDRIHEELQNGHTVIVHCLAGQQRSPSVVAAYLMTYHKYTLEEAVRHIRSQKPDAFFWSINFLDSLQRYAMMLRV